MFIITKSPDLALRDNDEEVVEGGGKNLSKSKKSKNAKSGIQTYLRATKKPTFLTLALERPLTNWGKRLPKLQSSNTLIRNIISRLRLTLQAMS